MIYDVTITSVNKLCPKTSNLLLATTLKCMKWFGRNVTEKVINEKVLVIFASHLTSASSCTTLRNRASGHSVFSLKCYRPTAHQPSWMMITNGTFPEAGGCQIESDPVTCFLGDHGRRFHAAAVGFMDPSEQIANTKRVHNNSFFCTYAANAS